MRDKAAAKEERRREAIFAAWLEHVREGGVYRRLTDFKRACDRGAFAGLSRDEFGRKDAVDAQPETADSLTP